VAVQKIMIIVINCKAIQLFCPINVKKLNTKKLRRIIEGVRCFGRWSTCAKRIDHNSKSAQQVYPQQQGYCPQQPYLQQQGFASQLPVPYLPPGGLVAIPQSSTMLPLASSGQIPYQALQAQHWDGASTASGYPDERIATVQIMSESDD
jgi:hypothetical protein